MCYNSIILDFKAQISRCCVCLESISPSSFNEENVEEAAKIVIVAKKIGDDSIIASISKIYNEEEDTLIKKCYSHKSCTNSLLYQTSQSSLELYEEHIDPFIDDILSKGYGIPISELNCCLVKVKPNFKFYNNLIKAYIVSKYAGRVSFCNPYRKK